MRGQKHSAPNPKECSSTNLAGRVGRMDSVPRIPVSKWVRFQFTAFPPELVAVVFLRPSQGIGMALTPRQPPRAWAPPAPRGQSPYTHHQTHRWGFPSNLKLNDFRHTFMFLFTLSCLTFQSPLLSARLKPKPDFSILIRQFVWFNFSKSIFFWPFWPEFFTIWVLLFFPPMPPTYWWHKKSWNLTRVFYFLIYIWSLLHGHGGGV